MGKLLTIVTHLDSRYLFLKLSKHIHFYHPAKYFITESPLLEKVWVGLS
jgi:hypothetical protein